MGEGLLVGRGSVGEDRFGKVRYAGKGQFF
jgi:hypothetical protein